MRRPDLPAALQQRCGLLYRILVDKYGCDRFNDWFFAGGTRWLGEKLWQIGDVRLIDDAVVNGAARFFGRLAGIIRHLQTGLIYHYAFAMIIGAFLMLTFFMKV